MCADFNTCMPFWLGYAYLVRDVLNVNLLIDALFPGIRTKSIHALAKKGLHRMVELHWRTCDISLVLDGCHLPSSGINVQHADLFRVIFPLAKGRVMLVLLAFFGCSRCLLALRAHNLMLERSPERSLQYSKHLKVYMKLFRRGSKHYVAQYQP